MVVPKVLTVARVGTHSRNGLCKWILMPRGATLPAGVSARVTMRSLLMFFFAGALAVIGAAPNS